MEILAVNLKSHGARYTTFNGRKTLVVKMTMMVPGILNGSKGPLFYGKEEIERNPNDWNGMPVVVYHPVVNGQHLSARTPEIASNQQIGTVYNTAVTPEGKLTAEAWIDVDHANRVDNRVVSSIDLGTPMELSTGLFAKRKYDPGVFNSSEYDFKAVDFKPDHLAVLPDQTGACSINDGCGINNKTKEVPLTTPQVADTDILEPTENNLMAKEKIVADLIANCDCYNEKDSESLNALSESVLKSMLENSKLVKDLQVKVDNASKVVDAATKGFETDTGLYAFNAKSNAWEHVPKEEEPKPEPKEVPVENKQLTEEEYLAAAPKSIRTAIQNAQRVEQQAKDSIVAELTSNLEDGDSKDAILVDLLNKELSELETLQSIAKSFVKEAPSSPVANFYGRLGAPAAAPKADETKIEPLALPKIDWASN